MFDAFNETFFNNVSNSSKFPANPLKSYTKITNFIRGSLALIALLLSLLVILVFCLKSQLRRSKINWSIFNLMLSNVLFCWALITYSFIKYQDSKAPKTLAACLTLNWATVAVSFGPLWSIAMMTFLRALSYRNPAYWDQKLSLPVLIGIRGVILILDLILACLIIHDAAKYAESTHCAYQTMLEKSIIYVAYNIIVGTILIIGGLSALIERQRLRYRLVKSKVNKIVFEIATISSSTSVSNTVPTSSSSLPITTEAPSILWKKPKFIFLFLILVGLFALPRIAFLTPDNKLFWQTATLCPPVIALVFAFAFLTVPKDFRQATAKFCYWKNDVAPDN